MSKRRGYWPRHAAESTITNGWVPLSPAQFRDPRDELRVDLHLTLGGQYVFDAPAERVDAFLREVFDRRRREIMDTIVIPSKLAHDTPDGGLAAWDRLNAESEAEHRRRMVAAGFGATL